MADGTRFKIRLNPLPLADLNAFYVPEASWLDVELPIKAMLAILSGWDGAQPHLVQTDASGRILVSVVGNPADNIAQWAGVNVAMGQQTANNSIPVAIASNQSAVSIIEVPAGGARGAQTQVTASATGAAAAIVATLPAVAGVAQYLTGFQVTGSGATAASVIVVTVTGVISGTMSYALAIPAGVAVAVQPLIVPFAQPVAASANNVAIAVNVPSFGAGNTNAAVAAQGFYV